MNKCDVCGKEGEVFVACSSCGASSYSYCAECLDAYREPYAALVGMGMTSDCVNKVYKQQVLLPSLKFFGKTIEEFDADVKKIDEAFTKYWKAHPIKFQEEDCDSNHF